MNIVNTVQIKAWYCEILVEGFKEWVHRDYKFLKSTFPHFLFLLRFKE